MRLFEFLTDEERSEFMAEAHTVSFGTGEDIITEGSQPGSMFVLLSGRVEVRKNVSSGRDRLLAEIDAERERTVVGERGLLGESEASATVRTTSEVEAIEIPRNTFRRMISENRPAAFKLSYRIACTLAQRLNRLDEEVVGVIREMDTLGDADIEAFRDRLLTEWSI